MYFTLHTIFKIISRENFIQILKSVSKSEDSEAFNEINILLNIVFNIMCQKWYNVAISDNFARSLRDKDPHVGVRQGRKRVLNAPTLFEEEDLGAVVSLSGSRANCSPKKKGGLAVLD